MNALYYYIIPLFTKNRMWIVKKNMQTRFLFRIPFSRIKDTFNWGR